jgi:CheY-like chemotaxis protein
VIRNPASSLPDFSKIRLLLAEDDGDAVIIFTRLLGKCGARLKHAPNGRIAIEYLTPYTETGGSEFAPDAIFLDIKMPMHNGFDVLKWIRDQPSLDSVAAIMLSSSNHPSDIEKARQLGANAYVEKFPSQSELVKLLSAVTAQRAPIGRKPLAESGLL